MNKLLLLLFFISYPSCCAFKKPIPKLNFTSFITLAELQEAKRVWKEENPEKQITGQVLFALNEKIKEDKEENK